jgi:hypothetical protein
VTFVLALATADYGLLATDTRSFARGQFRDGLAPKLRELLPGRAWGAGTGMQQWTSAALDLIADRPRYEFGALAEALRQLAATPEIQDLVARRTPEERALLEGWAQSRATRDGLQTGTLGKLVLVHRNAAGYGCATIDDAGIVQQYPRGQLHVSTPPGLDPVAVRARVMATWPALPRGRDEAIRRAAELVLWSCAQTEYMSAALEAVYLSPARAVHVGPAPAADFFNARVPA